MLRAFTPAHLQHRLQEIKVGTPLLVVGFGCSRSAEVLSRLKLATRERLLSLSPTFSAVCAKVKFQGRPVPRCEIGHRQQRVGSVSSKR
jgi:hypothetical protein